MDTRVDYLKPPRGLTAVWWFACLALVLAAAWFSWQSVQAYRLTVEAERQSARLSGRVAKRPPPKKNRSAIEEQKRWEALGVERTFAWGVLFNAVERAASEDIELLAFEPDKANRNIKLSGEARDQRALMIFLDGLAAQPVFKNVHLTHQQKKKHERLETVTFEVKAIF